MRVLIPMWHPHVEESGTLRCSGNCVGASGHTSSAVRYLSTRICILFFFDIWICILHFSFMAYAFELSLECKWYLVGKSEVTIDLVWKCDVFVCSNHGQSDGARERSLSVDILTAGRLKTAALAECQRSAMQENVRFVRGISHFPGQHGRPAEPSRPFPAAETPPHSVSPKDDNGACAKEKLHLTFSLSAALSGLFQPLFLAMQVAAEPELLKYSASFFLL